MPQGNSAVRPTPLLSL